MKKKFPLLSLILLLLFLFPSCSEKDITLVHISDPHYLSSSLFDYERLRDLMLRSDGKSTHIMDRVMDEFVSEMIKLKPEAVVITGDLTYNGEKDSHLELREKLRPLMEKGIKVYTTVGNHDTLTTPYALLKDRVVETDGTSPLEGEEIWLDYGYGKAEYQDQASSSYLTNIKDDLWLLVLDTNNGSGGSVRKATLLWMDEVLKEVKEKGGRIISATHQNLFIHNPRYTFGYQINNSENVVDIYRENGVKLNLSGHLHIQHITKENGITEIAAESFADWPLQYGVLKIGKDGAYSYSTKELREKGLVEEAKTVFDSSTAYKFMKNISSPDLDKMTEVAEKLNREYFRGKVDECDKEALELWNDEYRLSNYLMTIAGDTTDYRVTEGEI